MSAIISSISVDDCGGDNPLGLTSNVSYDVRRTASGIYGVYYDGISICFAYEQTLIDNYVCTYSGPAKTMREELGLVEKDVGRKFDGDKLRYDLFAPESFRELVRVLTNGASKYSPDNWKKVEGRRDRYYAALMRHVQAWRAGERDDIDGDFISHHLANAMCCLYFLLQEDLEEYSEDV